MRQMLGHTGKHRHSAPGRLPPLQTSGLRSWSACLLALGNEPLQALWQRGLALRCVLNGAVHRSTVNALLSVPALSTQARERPETDVCVHKEPDREEEKARESLKLLHLALSVASTIVAGSGKSDEYLLLDFPACIATLRLCSALLFPQLA